MIIQEIKLHPEPTPYVPTTPPKQNTVGPFNAKGAVNWSFHELTMEQTKAINCGMRIGTRWRYKGSDTFIEIMGWQLTPTYVTTCQGSPAIIRARRYTKIAPNNQEFIFNYTIDELLEMEPHHE